MTMPVHQAKIRNIRSQGISSIDHRIVTKCAVLYIAKSNVQYNPYSLTPRCPERYFTQNNCQRFFQQHELFEVNLAATTTANKILFMYLLI